MQEKAREEQAIGGKALRERQSLAALRGQGRRTNPQREQVLTDSHKQPFMRVLCHPKSYTPLATGGIQISWSCLAMIALSQNAGVTPRVTHVVLSLSRSLA